MDSQCCRLTFFSPRCIVHSLERPVSSILVQGSSTGLTDTGHIARIPNNGRRIRLSRFAERTKSAERRPVSGRRCGISWPETMKNDEQQPEKRRKTARNHEKRLDLDRTTAGAAALAPEQLLVIGGAPSLCTAEVYQVQPEGGSGLP